MRLNRDFSEFVACCVARDVRFLIVGGYAVAAHGHPRYTDGIRFEACYERRLTILVDDVPEPCIDLQSLRRNKSASGRPQDLADLAALEDSPGA